MRDERTAARLANTSLAAVPFVPEIRLYQAGQQTGLWDLTGGDYHSDQPPPFWAFAWPGGQGLARFLLDRPEVVAGRRVLDVASGSGLVAVAAARAGAARVEATDRDPDAVAAIELNASANGVAVTAVQQDITVGDARGADLVLAADAFYSESLADQMVAFLRRACRAGAGVLVADADRPYLPRARFEVVATYEVPARPALEGVPVARTTVMRARSR